MKVFSALLFGVSTALFMVAPTVLGGCGLFCATVFFFIKRLPASKGAATAPLDPSTDGLLRGAAVLIDSVLTVGALAGCAVSLQAVLEVLL
ncbi:MAG: hypothetical protein AAFR76_01580 [Planctomycetota bacterium]